MNKKKKEQKQSERSNNVISYTTPRIIYRGNTKSSGLPLVHNAHLRDRSISIDV